MIWETADEKHYQHERTYPNHMMTDSKTPKASNVVKILLADDSSIIRRMLQKSLNIPGRTQVVAAAENGKEALRLLKNSAPDVILLDVEMPVMDGIETVIAIRRINKLVPILMFSTLTSTGSEATMDALYHGADDCAAKPSKLGSPSAAVDYLQKQLVPKLESLAKRANCNRANNTGTANRPPNQTKIAPARNNVPNAERKSSNGPVESILIASSTGGPQALTTFLKGIPKSFALPILIAQHMPPKFTTLLAQRLNDQCALNVREAVDGQAVEAGTVLIAPGNFHMTVVSSGFGRKIKLNSGPPENSCRPAADVLFRSAAKCYGAAALGIVMTGMGKDGLEGSRQIVEAGGRIWAQDKTSSTVWAMPGAVVGAGFTERILPLPQISGELVQAIELSNCVKV